MFDVNKTWEDINEIIELYNIKKFFDNDIYLLDWDERTKDHYKSLMPSISKVIASFMLSINSDNFTDIASTVKNSYKDDFWNLFTSYGVNSRVNSSSFSAYLEDSTCFLQCVLKNEKLVKFYGNEIAEFMRSSDQTGSILIAKFFEQNDKVKYYLPKELRPVEFESIFLKYINSGTGNVNKLELLSLANNIKECPVSDKIKLKVKHAIEQYWADNEENSIRTEFAFMISFESSEKIKTVKQEDGIFKITYDIDWILKNLDYPTLLNNFIYLFEQFDIDMRCKYVIEEWKPSVLEELFVNNGRNHYNVGSVFDYTTSFYDHQTYVYYKILERNNVYLENIFKCFFEDYLRDEFGVEGFTFNPPTHNSTLVEKCRTLSSEMDGVLKQYRLFLKEGEINRELLEMSSGHIVFSDLMSFSEHKYAYGTGNLISNEQYLLFSDQCMLGYVEKFGGKYDSFYDLLIKNEVNLSDFEEYQIEDINWLSGRGAIEIDENNFIHLCKDRVYIMKELYDHSVICAQHLETYKNVLNQLYSAGELIYDGTLFSIPEQNYLNYILNRSKYSNGLDLRNKYIHSTYPQNENVQRHDYVVLLRMMLLVIFKMNEEFCFRDLYK